MGMLLFMCSTRGLVNIKDGYVIGCCCYNVMTRTVNTYYTSVPKHQISECQLIEL